MTREQAKQMLITFGIEAPSDEQITNYLNSLNGEVQKEKAKAEANKEELERLKEVEKEFEATKNANLTAEEKYQKAIKDMEAKSKQSAVELNKLKAENILVSAGLKQEEFADLLGGFVTDNTEQTVNLVNGLANLLKTQKEATEKAVKAELLNNTPTPDGGTGSGQTKTEAEKLVETLVQEKADANKASQEAINYYTGGNK